MNRSTGDAAASCELCMQTGGDLLWGDAACRVVLIADPDYPGYCRVIWNAHVKEMTDLDSAGRAHCMRVVYAVEQALRNVLAPHKINLASLGNLVPHLHWHVIPRFAGDAHFPNPVWGERVRAGPGRVRTEPGLPLRERLAAAISKSLPDRIDDART